MTYRKALDILRGSEKSKIRAIFNVPQYVEAVRIATKVLAKEVEKQESAEDAEFKDIE